MPQGKNEWYTHPRYIEAAREVMGGIDLDPASCELANRTVKATYYYTEQDNGLLHPWNGRVWLNPPYGRINGKGASVIKMFVTKCIREFEAGNIEQAVLLITVRTDASWFQSLWEHTICFTDHLLHFYKPSGDGVVYDGQWGHFFGTAFVYMGKNEQRFIDIFSEFGTIAKRVCKPRHKHVNLSLWEVSNG